MTTPLPIDAHLPEIVERLRESRALVLVAPPGAGKTTRVPPAVLRAGLLAAEHPNVVMLQPRRVAARASAERIAEENGWELGREVGYHVRFDRKIGPRTHLRVLTEGILTRQLLEDPFLEGVGCVILDEFHERSIHTDLCAALLREVRQTVREDLILIVMSATLEAEPVARFLGDCPIVRAEGRTFPVEIRHAGWSQEHISERAADAVMDLLSAEGPSAPYALSSLNAPRHPERSEGSLRPRAGEILRCAQDDWPSIENGGRSGKRDDDPVGDILVFLPGVEEIRRTMARLDRVAAERDLLLLPLHGSLRPEEQMLALRPSPRRKVICATNVAETSLTIDGVRTVIDTGYARIAGYDPERGLDRLDLQRISKASAAQRAGRAGRTAPGQCVRLWSASEERAMPDFTPPEIRRVDLAGTVLMLHAWGKPDPRSFGWYDPPPEEAIAAAERLLAMLGALTSEQNGEITPLGRRMMALPVHPRLARLLLAAAEGGMLEEGTALAALLSEKDIAWEDRSSPPWQRQAKTVGPSDLLIRLEMLHEAERARFAAHLRERGINPEAARQVVKVREDLLRVAGRRYRAGRHLPPSPGTPGEGGGEGDFEHRVRNDGAPGPQNHPHPNPLPEYREREQTDTASVNEAPLRRLALLAYPDRVCKRRTADPSAGVMVGGGGVRLAAESVVRHGEFFLALDARQDARSASREALVRIASTIEEPWLAELFPQSVRTERAVEYDPQRERVVGFLRVWYRDLLLREEPNVAVDPEAAATALANALRRRAAEIFAGDEAAANLLARVALLRQHMPEHAWPAFDADELGEVLAEVSRGKRSLEDIRRAPLAAALSSRLPYPLDRLLEQHAPERIAVPSGSQVRLDYTAGAAPVLAVRLQEVFGWTDTPRVAGGRVPVLLHLLGPNFRPVQVTNDLRSFWSGTYFQVRKDLRVRYPRHAWPEDPLNAKPEAKGGRRAK